MAVNRSLGNRLVLSEVELSGTRVSMLLDRLVIGLVSFYFKGLSSCLI